MRRIAAVLALVAGVCPNMASARDRLGIWNDWGAFRDAGVPRCYAIAMAMAQPGQKREAQPYLTVANWPRRGIHGEVHLRLSRTPAPDRPVMIAIGGQKFAAQVSGIDAWAIDRRADAAIIAAMRSNADMTVLTTGRDGQRLRDAYRLAGAASAMDAASLACAAS